MKILFVDDEPDILDQAKIFLEKEKEELEVETVDSAKEALTLIDEKEYDAVVSDYLMPEMNGIEFLKEFGKEKDNIPFILLTGRGDEKIAMKALNLGADQYIQKSGSPETQYGLLAKTVIREVKRKRLKEENQKLQNLLEEDMLDELYSIQTTLESLQNLDLSDEEEEYVEDAISNAQEGISLITEVSEKRNIIGSLLQKLKQKVLNKQE